MKTLFALLAAIGGLVGLGSSALGQDYPNRAVRILVGYPPGGIPDLVTRATGQALSQILGQQFVVENKPGASATLATDLVAKAPADGYTLLTGETGQLEIAPYLFKALPYDTLRDLTPISHISSTTIVFVANSKSNIRTIKDLIREAKANPGKLNYGSSGIGSIHHIIFEAFNAAAGIKMTHIPYKGAQLTLAALLSGEVHAMMTGLGVVTAQRQAGTVTLIGVTSAERYPFTPDIPPISDELKDFDFSSEAGILAPAGLPPEVLAKLSRSIKAAVETPDVQDRFKKLGLVLSWTTPEAYREKIRQNLKKFEQVVRTANIQAN